MLALMLRLPVVGCSVLYVLRFAGGPEGKMPTTFCWTTPVEKKDYVRKEADIHAIHAERRRLKMTRSHEACTVCGEQHQSNSKKINHNPSHGRTT